MISIDICGITENDNKHHEREFKGTLSSVKKWFQVGTYIDDICLYYFFWFSAPPLFFSNLDERPCGALAFNHCKDNLDINPCT